MTQRLAREPATKVPFGPPAHAPWVTQTTIENRALAGEIDELEQLDLDAFRRRRDITEMRAADPSDPHYEQYKRTLEAFEFLEARRIAPMRVRRPLLSEDYDGGSHPIRRRNVRVVVEQGVQQSGSLRQSIKDMNKPTAIDNDIYFIERDAELFGARFVVQAKEFAREMLAQSADEILTEIRRYGLRRSSALYAANRILHGEDPSTVVRDTVNASAVWDPDEDPAHKPTSALTWRESLGAQVTQLRAQQREVQDRRKDLSRQIKRVGAEIWIPDPAGYKATQARIAEAEKRLAAMWLRAERVHKVLASFRGGAPSLADADLGGLDDGSFEGHPQMTAVLTNLLQKLADIGTIQYRIKVGNLSPCSLPPVVAVTKAAMFVPPGSIRDGKVNDLVEDAQDTGVAKYIAEGLLALIVIATLIPSGGATLGLAIGLASAALSATSAVEDWETYKKRKLLANTALDRAKALSTEEPSLLPFAIDLVSLGLDGLPLIKAFGSIVAMRNLVRARQEIESAEKLTQLLNELDKIGATKNESNLGEQILKDLNSAEHDTQSAARQHPKSPGPKPPFHPPPGQPYATVAELRDSIQGPLRSLYHGSVNVNPEWFELLSLDWATLARSDPAKARLFEQVEKVFWARRDPERIEKLIVRLYTEAGKDGISPQKWLVRHFGGQAGMPRIRDLSADPEVFRKALLADKPAIDLAFGSVDHGAFVHMFDEYLVEDVLGSIDAARDFRRAIANAESPSIMKAISGGATYEKKLYSLIWDALFDAGDVNQINRAESLGAILIKHLGFMGRAP